MACEPVYVKIVDYTSAWFGALRIGFTMNDPMSFKSDLPDDVYMSDFHTKYGIWMVSVAENLVQLSSVLHFYADQNGDVHYGINSGERGILFGGVDTSGGLWAVIDVYAQTVAVEFIDPTCSTEYTECEKNEGTCVTNSSTVGCIVDSYAQRMRDKDEKQNCKDKYRGCLNSKGTCKVKEDGVFCQCPDIATYSTEMKKCTIGDEKCEDTFPGCLSSGGVCRLKFHEVSCQCPELASYKIDKKMCLVENGTCDDKFPGCLSSRGFCELESNKVSCQCPGSTTYRKEEKMCAGTEYMPIALWVLCLIAVTIILIFGYMQCRKRNQ